MPDADPVLREPWPFDVQRILVVDRDESFVASIKQLMASHPCNVDWAQDDSEALAMIDKARLSQCYDVILADHLEVLKSGSALWPMIKVDGNRLPIVLTCSFGYNFDASMVKLRQMGVRVSLYKPFKVEQFFEAVSRIRHSARSE